MINLLSIQRLSAFIGNHRLIVGGSFAQKRHMFETPHIQPNDIDLFIVGKRSMETWAFIEVLKLCFDKVDLDNGEAKDGKYKIEGQYNKFTAYSDGVKYDIIMIDTDDIFKSMGSTLSMILYEFHRFTTVEQLRIMPHEHRDKKLNSRVCEIYKSANTQEQIDKVKLRCNLLNIKCAVY